MAVDLILICSNPKETHLERCVSSHCRPQRERQAEVDLEDTSSDHHTTSEDPSAQDPPRQGLIQRTQTSVSQKEMKLAPGTKRRALDLFDLLIFTLTSFSYDFYV